MRSDERLPQSPPLPPVVGNAGGRRGARWWHGLPLALQFLTVLPVRVPTPPADEPFDMTPALPWFPLVGALLGVGLVAFDVALTPLLRQSVRDALLLAAVASLTGMLHLDGFVDCCDALLGTRSVERRLQIMHDSRVGAYGALGAVLLLLTKYAALGALAGEPRLLVVFLAPLLGRWSIVYAVTRYPYARGAGLGSLYRPRLAHLLAATPLTVALAALPVALVALTPAGALLRMGTLGVGGTASVALLVGALALATLLIVIGWTRWASHRLDGGLTGDTYGAANELVELGVLVLAASLSSWLLR